MSANEVGNIAQSQIKRLNEKHEAEEQSSKTESDIEVFASDNVSAKVDLRATESNSLFSEINLHAVNGKASVDAPSETDKPVTELPEDISKKYPSEEEQAALKTLNQTELEQAKKLMDYKFPAVNIVQIVKMFKPEDIDKIKKQADEITEASGGKDNIYLIGLSNDKYDKEAYTLSALNFDMSLKTNVLNSDLSTRSIEDLSEHIAEDGTKYRMREAYDLKTNTISKTRYDFDSEHNTFVANYEIRSKIRDDGSMVSREYIKPSAVAGLYDTEVLTEEGKKDTSKVKQKKNGKTSVRRDMESPDGTKTEYLYRDDPKGNRYMRYKITDKDGKVLMNNKKSFKVVDENTFKSTFNDKSYTMTVKDNILYVKNDNDEKETAQIDLSSIEGKKESLIAILKQMPGDQLISLSRTTDKLVGIDNVLESYYTKNGHEINSGDDMFVVLHESGHAKDFQTLNMYDALSTENSMISRDKELTEIFKQEKEEFNKAFPDAQREHVDYFINILSHYGGPQGSIQETVAESNAILNTPRSHKILGLRTQYLQQYFPKTIAKLNVLLGENRERAEQKIVFHMPDIALPEIKIPKIPIPKE